MGPVHTASSSPVPKRACEGMLCSADTAPVSDAVPCRRLLGRPKEPPASPSRDACCHQRGLTALAACETGAAQRPCSPFVGLSPITSTTPPRNDCADPKQVHS